MNRHSLLFALNHGYSTFYIFWASLANKNLLKATRGLHLFYQFNVTYIIYEDIEEISLGDLRAISKRWNRDRKWLEKVGNNSSQRIDHRGRRKFTGMEIAEGANLLHL